MHEASNCHDIIPLVLFLKLAPIFAMFFPGKRAHDAPVVGSYGNERNS